MLETVNYLFQIKKKLNPGCPQREKRKNPNGRLLVITGNKTETDLDIEPEN